MDSLPFNDTNASLAISNGLADPIVDWFLHTVQTSPAPKQGPRGQFYNKDGQPIPPPLSRNAERPTYANEYGLMLNAYGETGKRSLWLSYTNGRRQMY